MHKDSKKWKKRKRQQGAYRYSPKRWINSEAMLKADKYKSFLE
jgi:hypothetical protein